MLGHVSMGQVSMLVLGLTLISTWQGLTTMATVKVGIRVSYNDKDMSSVPLVSL